VGDVTIPKGTLPPGAIITIMRSTAESPTADTSSCSGESDSVSAEIGVSSVAAFDWIYLTSSSKGSPAFDIGVQRGPTKDFDPPVSIRLLGENKNDNCVGYNERGSQHSWKCLSGITQNITRKDLLLFILLILLYPYQPSTGFNHRQSAIHDENKSLYLFRCVVWSVPVGRPGLWLDLDRLRRSRRLGSLQFSISYSFASLNLQSKQLIKGSCLVFMVFICIVYRYSQRFQSFLSGYDITVVEALSKKVATVTSAKDG